MFGADPQYAAEITQFRLPDLAHALLLQRKVADAKAILTPLVMNEEQNPTFQMLMDWSMSVTGWLEGWVLLAPGGGGVRTGGPPGIVGGHLAYNRLERLRHFMCTLEAILRFAGQGSGEPSVECFGEMTAVRCDRLEFGAADGTKQHR